jgi:hypothetical protein
MGYTVAQFVDALRYKSERSRVRIQMVIKIFFIDIGPDVEAAFNINEYQKYLLGGGALTY